MKGLYIALGVDPWLGESHGDQTTTFWGGPNTSNRKKNVSACKKRYIAQMGLSKLVFTKIQCGALGYTFVVVDYN